MARPIAKDYEAKRTAILRAAARLFADEGYGRASMAQVAAACEISKANIYHYYPSKSALLFGILETHLCGLRDRIGALDHPSPDPADQLERIMAELLCAYQGADAEHAVQLSAMAALAPAEQDILRGYQRALVQMVRQRVAELVPTADRATLRALTMSVFALVNWHYQWDGAADQSARRAYARLICLTLTRGMGALPPTPKL